MVKIGQFSPQLQCLHLFLITSIFSRFITGFSFMMLLNFVTTTKFNRSTSLIHLATSMSFHSSPCSSLPTSHLSYLSVMPKDIFKFLWFSFSNLKLCYKVARFEFKESKPIYVSYLSNFGNSFQ
jgi:hypothetical protein